MALRLEIRCSSGDGNIHSGDCLNGWDDETGWGLLGIRCLWDIPSRCQVESDTRCPAHERGLELGRTTWESPYASISWTFTVQKKKKEYDWGREFPYRKSLSEAWSKRGSHLDEDRTVGIKVPRQKNLQNIPEVEWSQLVGSTIGWRWKGGQGPDSCELW